MRGNGEGDVLVPSERVIALKERLYKDQIDGTSLFRELISERLGPHARVLDLGCGKGKDKLDFRATAQFVVGCDIDQSVKENCSVAMGIRGDAYALPFQNGSFHLIVSDFVFEHIEFPDRLAREAFRVLISGGHLIFRTPNLYHYVSIIGSMTPHWFHRQVANRVRGLNKPAEQDVFPTYYRANTRHAVERVFAQAGFVPEQIRMIEREPSYMMFSRTAFLLGYWYERLVNRYEMLARFRSNIFGVVRKPGA